MLIIRGYLQAKVQGTCAVGAGQKCSSGFSGERERKQETVYCSRYQRKKAVIVSRDEYKEERGEEEEREV